MTKGWDRRKLIGMTALAALGVALLVLVLLSAPEGGHDRDEGALVGEARQGGLTVALHDVVRDVKVTEARAPGRPIVLIDPGHGLEGRHGPEIHRITAIQRDGDDLPVDRNLDVDLAQRVL